MSINSLLPEVEPYKDKIPEFILKLYHILEKKQHSNYLAWFNDDQIVIKNSKKFQDKVLPRYFRHKHIASFIRQLNMYQFSKVYKIQKEKNHMYFKNDHFKRGHIESLLKLKRNVKRKNLTEQTIIPGREDEFEVSDNISINQKLAQNHKSLKDIHSTTNDEDKQKKEEEKRAKQLQAYRAYVEKSATSIKQLAKKYAAGSTYQNEFREIMRICDELISQKEQAIRSFGLSSSNDSYENMTFLNISEKVLPKIEGDLIFPSQCSLSNFNSFQNG